MQDALQDVNRPVTPVDLGRPATLQQCYEVIDALTRLVELLGSQLAVQMARPAATEPSAAQAGASGRKRGAQLGHKGSSRALLDESQVDQVIDCAPVEVCECGAAVVTVADEPIRHQVFDVARYVATSLVGEQFTGILVSDHYAVYDCVDADQSDRCVGLICYVTCARIAQCSGLAGQVGRGLLGAGYVLFRWNKFGKTAVQFDPLRRRVKRLLVQGMQTQCSRTAKTCANLLKLWPALWTFVGNTAVPPTNSAWRLGEARTA